MSFPPFARIASARHQSGPRGSARQGRILSAMPDSAAQPARRPSVHRRRRHHRGRARRPERPRAAVLDGAPHRRPAVDPQRPAAALARRSTTTRAACPRTSRPRRAAWALPAIIEFRDGGCVLPPAPSDDLIREMMAFLACAPLDDDVVPMFLEDLHLDGADARAITWADEIPDDVRADAHVVVIGCGESGLLAGAPPRPGEAAVHGHREERRSRRHVVGEPLPGRTRRHRQPLLLLLVRARRPLDRVLLAAPRAARLLPTGARRARPRAALPVEHARRRHDLRRGHRTVGRRRHQPRRQHRDARRARGDQRGRCAQHAAHARHPGHGRLRRARRSTRRAGTTRSTTRASSSR